MEIEKFFAFKLANAKTGRVYKGTVTLCFRTVEDLDGSYIGLAFCSPLDEYDEEKGKKIARGRALCKRTQWFFFGKLLNKHCSIPDIIKWICYNTNLPIPWVPFGIGIKTVNWRELDSIEKGRNK